jgi:hypothetical protein
MGSTKRFSGLKLTEADRKELRQREAGGERMTARSWRRIQVLLLLDRGLSVRDAAAAVLRYPREVSRVGRRYLQGGLMHALSDDPRPKPSRMLDSSQEAAIVALVCGPAPEGRATWSTALIAAEAVRRGIVPRVGRETIRMVLSRHQLKPWREKNVVRPRDRRGVHSADGRAA